MLLAPLCSFAQFPITWTNSTQIANSSYDCQHPRIVVDALGNPMIVWVRVSDQAALFSRWNGTTFTTPVKLNPNGMQIAGASWFGPDIASKGDTVYVVMKRIPEDTDTSHIYITHSFNAGATFSAVTRVEYLDSGKSRFPTVTIDDSGNPIVAYMKFNVSFAAAHWVVTKSTNFGTTFTPEVKASGQKGGYVCDCCPGAIKFSDDVLSVFYRTNINDLRDSWAGISYDFGATFPKGYNLENKNWNLNYCPATGPDGVIIGDTLYSVFMNGVTGVSRSYFSKSAISSESVSTISVLSDNLPELSVQNYPRIDNSGNAVAIVWKQQVSGADQLPILFTNDIRKGFSNMFEGMVDESDITNADVALFNGKIYVVWQDDRSRTVKFRSGTYSQTNTEVVDSNPSLPFYPNPVHDVIHISGNYNRIDILNIIGMDCLVNINNNSIDVSTLNDGIYFLKLDNSIHKIIKIK